MFIGDWYTFAGWAWTFGSTRKGQKGSKVTRKKGGITSGKGLYSDENKGQKVFHWSKKYMASYKEFHNAHPNTTPDRLMAAMKTKNSPN